MPMFRLDCGDGVGAVIEGEFGNEDEFWAALQNIDSDNPIAIADIVTPIGDVFEARIYFYPLTALISVADGDGSIEQLSEEEE